MKIILISLVSIFFTSCSALKILKLQNKGTVQSTDFVKTSSFTKNNNLVIVSVKINGKDYNFIFDTGASFNVVSTELSAALGLKPVASMKVSNSQGTSSNKDFIVLDTVSIAGVAFYKQLCVVSDLKSIDCMFNNIDGIIGLKLMQKATWFINNEKSEITLTNNKNNLPQMLNAKSMALTIKDKTPYIDCAIDGFRHTEIEFDLGSANGFSLDKKHMTNPNGLSNNIYSIGNASKGLDGSGKVDTTFYIKKQNLQFGNVSIPTEQFVKVKTGHSSIIGMKILKNYNIVLDWNQKQILLDKINDIGTETINPSGFKYNKVGSQIQVVEIFANSNAAKAGLELGDVIKSINGINYYNLPYAAQCSLLSFPLDNTIEQYEMVVLKKNTEVKLNFKNTIF